MIKSLLGAAAPLLAVASLALSAPAPLPVPGPGAVIEAIQKFTQAIDSSDRASLGNAFATSCRCVSYRFDDRQEIKPSTDAMELAFTDVAVDGRVLTANSRQAAVDQLLEDVAGKVHPVKTTIRSIRADCPSADCSWGVVDFEREYRQGETKVVVPMRATVLVQFEKGKPGVSIFSWHASVLGSLPLAKK